MTTPFVDALRPFLLLSKALGLVNITYTFKSGLLDKNSSVAYFVCLELTRTVVLIGFTYVFHVNNTFYIRELVLIKFWTAVFMARCHEIWIIRLINGIIVFDRRLDELSLTVPGTAPARSAVNKRCSSWNAFLAAVLGSYVGLQTFSVWLWPPRRLDFGTLVKYFFEIPCVTEFAVFVTTHFYLRNLGSRFDALNRLCERLPAGLVATAAGALTQADVTRLMDRVRLLHSELCELLRVFGSAYGGMLLCYLAFNFVDLLRNFYFLMHVARSHSSDTIVDFSSLNVTLTVAFCLQNVVFVICILITVSRINEKKIEIVSFLRLIHISKLPIDTKLQVKMFMNQLSIFEWDQVSAFGFFHINLKLIISICILLTTTLATSLQMKEHPYVIGFNNAYHSYLRFEYNMG